MAVQACQFDRGLTKTSTLMSIDNVVADNGPVVSGQLLTTVLEGRSTTDPTRRLAVHLSLRFPSAWPHFAVYA